MSTHQQFRRQPVPQGMAMKHATVTLPAPIRGLIEVENWAYTKPGSAVVLENWFPTARGLKLRGGTQTWVQLPDKMPGNIKEPILSALGYISGNTHRIFGATATRLFDVSFADTPTLIANVTNGNYTGAQLANAGGNYLTIVNDAGDFPRRFDGTTWTYLNGGQITGPAGTPVVAGGALTYVWKYRSRLFFIQGGTMNAWYLDIDAINGLLKQIPLSGAATRGGSLLWGASWSIDAGDGIDDKCVFGTDQGEVLIFTGGNPGDINAWRQEGRYDISKPLGKNAHIKVGGDILLASVDGIVPLSASIQKDVAALSLDAISRNIEYTWVKEVQDKKFYPWTMCKWDEKDAMFVTFPGGDVNNRYCGVVNILTGAWTKFIGYDAMCFWRMRGDFFFGTQDGRVMQAESGGSDEGLPYFCKMVGGWEMFQAPPNTVTWFQARAAFFSRAKEPFEPQLSACVDYNFDTIPAPPPSGPDPGLGDYWDEGLWDVAKWDAPQPPPPPAKNTMWVSIGETGFSHAPVVQVTVAQQAKPDVELVSIAATFLRMGANV